jgi:hypothetical protein
VGVRAAVTGVWEIFNTGGGELGVRVWRDGVLIGVYFGN